MNEELRICHVSIKHRSDDNRIYELQAVNSARLGCSVTVIALTDNERTINNIRIIPVQKTCFKLLKQCLDQNCDIYELHDPQLLWFGVLLRILGKKVIFDAHENYEEKIKSRLISRYPVLKPVKNVIAKLWWCCEKVCVRLYNVRIAADSTVMEKYGKETLLLPNVPGKEFYTGLPQRARKDDTFRLIYVGTLTWDRGIVQTIQAIQLTRHKDIEFHIIGDTKDEKLIEYIKRSPKTIWHGRVEWRKLKNHLVESDVGIVLLQPVDAYLYYPGENIVKLWEYMSVGLPVLISDFPGLRRLCEKLQFGLPVKPDEPQKIADAIDWMIDHPLECARFGENGRIAVEKEYHAEKYIEKLLKIYQELVS